MTAYIMSRRDLNGKRGLFDNDMSSLISYDHEQLEAVPFQSFPEFDNSEVEFTDEYTLPVEQEEVPADSSDIGDQDRTFAQPEGEKEGEDDDDCRLDEFSVQDMLAYIRLNDPDSLKVRVKVCLKDDMSLAVIYGETFLSIPESDIDGIYFEFDVSNHIL